MAVMLTQWSPVPWSGETVPRPSVPPPAGSAASTPIYETLVREWSLAGRTVPGQGRRSRSESPESVGRWWRAEEARPPYGTPSAAAPAPAAQAYGGGPPGTSPAPYRSVSPYVGVSGYGDGGDASVDRRAEPRPAPSGATDAGDTPAGPDTKRPPAWERVAIL